MADDAELAFLHAQANEAEYDPASYHQSAPANEDEYDPAVAFSPRAPSEQSAEMAESPAAETSAPNEGDLKPQPAEAAPTPSKKPRTMGGFVVDSEDEDEVSPVTAAKTADSALLNEGTSSESANNTLPQPDVPLSSAQDQAVPGVSFPHVAVNIVAPSASAASNSGTPVPDTKPAAALDLLHVASARQSTAPVTPINATSLPKPRLPQDKVGILEDRIAEDPRGDIEAWLSLIEEHRRRHKYDDARAVFERFFKVFPTSGEEWVEYVKMETELDDLPKVEQLFGRSITGCQFIPLWSSYVDYIRRRYNLTTDTSGQARQVVTSAYDFVLDQVGIDVDSGKIWLDYIEMLKSGPGTLGGSSWQDMQKMDTLRKAYQRAVSVPTNATLEIWREYDKFEMALNKATGRKYLQEKSSAYMNARSAITVLDNTTRGVIRTTLPKLPPAPGFDGHDEYMNQVQLWKNWIQWEKSDPLDIRADDSALYNKRILYLYKKSLMALRFWPEMWYEAAEWCFESGIQDEGDKFLNDGIEANPESCLLAFRKAHQVELRTDFPDGEEGIIQKGKEVRESFNKVLDALYELTSQTKKREEHSIVRAKEAFHAQIAAEEAARTNSDKNSDDDDDVDEEVQAEKRRQEKQDALDAQLQAISAGYNAQIHILKKTLSYAWIALMRAMRRVQGKGAPNAAVSGFRGVFAEARKKGKLLSDAYVASALIEHHCYQDPAAIKIFDRGMKLFPDDEQFALEYIKHLVKQNDATNARAVFETVVTRLTSKPENVQKAKPLFVFFHDYESQYGELAQIVKLEQRMASLYPEDPQLQRFSQRFSNPTFDPMTVRPIISPRTQMKPVMPVNVVPSVEEPPPTAVPPQVAVQEPQRIASPGLLNSPRLANLLPVSNSPKRPLEDADNDLAQPRKLIRGESPLKGAAGRRLDAARRNQQGNTPVGPPPAPLPREINFLLGIIPGAHTYKETRFNAERMVALLRNIPHAQVPLPANLAQSQAFQQLPPVGRWGGTTATTAAQIQDIQTKYGGGAQGGWQ